jgi:hypothetical protein
MCRSAAPAGTAKETATTSNKNTLDFITFLLWLTVMESLTSNAQCVEHRTYRVHLVCFVHLVSHVQLNKPNKQDRPASQFSHFMLRWLGHSAGSML